MASGGLHFDVEFDGHEDMMFAFRKAAKELRGTDQQSEIYKVGPRTAKRIAIPALQAAASSGPPQAKKTVQNLKAKRGRVPQVEFVNKAGNFTSRRWKGDQPRWGAIYWGSLFGGSIYFGPKSTWIRTTVKAISPMVRREYQKGLTSLLRKANLL